MRWQRVLFILVLNRLSIIFTYMRAIKIKTLEQLRNTCPIRYVPTVWHTLSGNGKGYAWKDGERIDYVKV